MKKFREAIYYTLLRFLVYSVVFLFELFVLLSIVRLVDDGNTSIATLVASISYISTALIILIVLLLLAIAYMKVSDVLGRRKV